MGLHDLSRLRIWTLRSLHGVSLQSDINVENSTTLTLHTRWAHEICADDNEERALVIGSMNEMAYVLQAWLPLIIWQQTDAPRFQKGYITVTCLSVMLIATAFAVRYLHRRQIAQKETQSIQESLQVEDTSEGSMTPPTQVDISTKF